LTMFNRSVEGRAQSVACDVGAEKQLTRR
jgi:hypothetical protein